MEQDKVKQGRSGEGSGSEEKQERREPRGFGEHARSRNSENAHEQGWGLNQEQRARESREAGGSRGGTDYDYGARDFGDEPVDTSAAQPARSTMEKAEEFRGPRIVRKKKAA